MKKENKNQISRFHYTVGESLKSIIKSGEIKLAVAVVDTTQERPAVFCSIDKLWEPTAFKSLLVDDGMIALDTIDKMIKYAGPLARIEVKPEAAPYSWADYVALSGISRKLAHGLELSALKLGSNVKHFFIGFKPIKLDQFLSVQIMDEKKCWMVIEGAPESLKGMF